MIRILLHEFCEHHTEPLRVDEVEVTQVTVIFEVEEYATVMEEADRLVYVGFFDPINKV